MCYLCKLRWGFNGIKLPCCLFFFLVGVRPERTIHTLDDEMQSFIIIMLLSLSIFCMIFVSSLSSSRGCGKLLNIIIFLWSSYPDFYLHLSCFIFIIQQMIWLVTFFCAAKCRKESFPENICKPGIYEYLWIQ